MARAESGGAVPPRRWLDGREVCDADGLPFDASEPLWTGDGAFETLRVEHGAAFFANAHAERLVHALRSLHLLHPPDADAFTRRFLDDVSRAARAAPDSVARLRVSAWPRPSGAGLHLFAQLRDEPQPLDPRPLRLGALRDDEAPRAGRGKRMSWGFAAAARRAARARGCDDALWVRDGRLVEASFGNLLVATADAFVAPSEGGLDGITLAELAKIVPITRGSVRLDALTPAHRLVVTSSVRLATPVAEVVTPMGEVRSLDASGGARWAEQLRGALRNHARNSNGAP